MESEFTACGDCTKYDEDELEYDRCLVPVEITFFNNWTGQFNRHVSDICSRINTNGNCRNFVDRGSVR